MTGPVSLVLPPVTNPAVCRYLVLYVLHPFYVPVQPLHAHETPPGRPMAAPPPFEPALGLTA